MRVVYADDVAPTEATFKRLLLLADEIAFASRPSVVFDDWGLIGVQTPVRPWAPPDAPVVISAYGPPSGPRKYYAGSILADFTTPAFVRTFLDGLANDDRFAARLGAVQDANYGRGIGTGADLRRALLADRDALLAADLGRPLEEMSPKTRGIEPEMGLFRIDSHEERVNALRHLMSSASVQISGALMVAAEIGLAPVSESPYFNRLIGVRLGGTSFLGKGGPAASGSLGLAIARSVVPDEDLQRLNVQDLLDYRKSARDAYRAWSAEVDKLATKLSEISPEKLEEEMRKIITTEVNPKLIQYEAEMKSTWANMFRGLASRVALGPVAALSVAHALGVNLTLPMAIATAAASIPGIVTDVLGKGAEAKGKNPLSYLIGVTAFRAETPPVVGTP